MVSPAKALPPSARHCVCTQGGAGEGSFRICPGLQLSGPRVVSAGRGCGPHPSHSIHTGELGAIAGRITIPLSLMLL